MKNSYKKNKYRDVLIVLGCAIFVRGVPRIMAERVRRAISVFRSGDYSLLILSGGPTKTPIPEAELMKLMAEKHISPKKIILEPVSVDTVQNAVFCWGLLKGKPVASITVVTSYFHMRRAKHIFSSVFAHTKIPLKFLSTPHFLPPLLALKIHINEFFYYIKILIKGID